MDMIKCGKCKEFHFSTGCFCVPLQERIDLLLTAAKNIKEHAVADQDFDSAVKLRNVVDALLEPTDA